MTDIYDPAKPAILYIRPGTKDRPIEYMDTVEKQGMLVDGKYATVMYTTRVGLNQGPQGPAGEDQNSKYDTIIASCSDEYTPLTIGGPKTTFRSPYALDLATGYIRISLTSAPTGSPLIVDLTMNGTSMFSTLVQIDAGSRTCVGSVVTAVLAITDVPDDAEFLPYITQVGSTLAGTGLKIAVTGQKVSP